MTPEYFSSEEIESILETIENPPPEPNLRFVLTSADPDLLKIEYFGKRPGFLRRAFFFLLLGSKWEQI
jgi:hypothetical protein